jgi:hypothetical protein
MTDPPHFTRAEWDLLGDAPLAACAAIAFSEPGGGPREADAVLHGWREAADLFPDSVLIQMLLRVLDPETREVKTWIEEGFDEPAGLSIADGMLYVADTNAHRIRVVDLKTKEVSTLELKGVEPPKQATE